jgi:hypothetical protein
MGADERVITGEVVGDEAEIAANPATRAVGEQQRGTAAPHEDVEARGGKRVCVCGAHVGDRRV